MNKKGHPTIKTKTWKFHFDILPMGKGEKYCVEE